MHGSEWLHTSALPSWVSSTLVAKQSGCSGSSLLVASTTVLQYHSHVDRPAITELRALAQLAI